MNAASGGKASPVGKNAELLQQAATKFQYTDEATTTTDESQLSARYCRSVEDQSDVMQRNVIGSIDRCLCVW